MSDLMTRAKIEKFLLAPMDARWEAWKLPGERDAFAEDAVRCLGKFDGDTIRAALLRVSDRWKYARRPRISEIFDAVREISSDKPMSRSTAESREGRANRVNHEAEEYAGRWMWETPEGRSAWDGGYPHEMREWVRVQAARQAYAGGPINVRIPAAQIDEWRAAVERGRRAHEELRARGAARPLGQITKQVHVAGAAE
jgi:Arc/MetJ-type ribon-helix-helix transcriptional regulator